MLTETPHHHPNQNRKPNKNAKCAANNKFITKYATTSQARCGFYVLVLEDEQRIIVGSGV
jgi:hypothetical protein